MKNEWQCSKKAEISTQTIISIIILILTLVILFFIITAKWRFLQDLWSRGPFG